MFIRSALRFLLPVLSFPVVEEGGGGGVSDTPSAPISDAPAVADVSSTPAVSAPAPAPTMLDAINEHFNAKTDPATGQPRDAQGRFSTAPATPAAPGAPVAPAAAVPAAPGAPVVAAPKPAATTPPAADDLTMPEGLQPKAQERFQRLAETVKSVSAERDEARGQVGYIREAFQQNNVQQPQFEQAVAVIGMLNRGDFQGALSALDEQRRQIALLTGQPLPGVDALSEHPDLRQAVDNLQLPESAAIELARTRSMQAAQQRQQQEMQRVQQTQQQEAHAVQTALGEVDSLVKQLQSTDIDFPAIEAQLLPSLKDLLEGVPPNRWKNAVQAQYSLLKRSASAFRASAPSPAPNVLRPTGQAAPGVVAKSLHEAMWGPRS